MGSRRMSLSWDVHRAMDDEAFLDLAFERICGAFEEGESPTAEELAAERTHLVARINELIDVARQIRPAAHQPLPSIPGYTLLREAGRGGMGAVYLARQDRLAGRPVALKVLPPSVALSPRARERFRDEVRAIARLSHPNIVAIHDVVAEDGLQAYAMEWIEGRTLADWISERAARVAQSRDSSPGVDSDSARVCDIGIAIAQALAAVHGAGLLHRDVKPSNILFRRDGTPLLGDFGLARETDAALTQVGHFVGTAAYAPPEQLRGDVERVDRRSDVYALGATLYHALALRPPFDGHDPTRLLRQIEGPGPRLLRKLSPRTPRDLATVIAKAMEPDPARRYQTAGELADDLLRVRSLRPIRARPAGLLTRGLKLVRRNRVGLVGAVAGGLAALAMVALLVTYSVLMPGWVSERVRTARLELVDPGHANQIVSTLYWGRLAAVTPEMRADRAAPLERALREYDGALRLTPFNAERREERAAVAAARDALLNPGPLRAAAAREIGGFSSARSVGLFAFLTDEYQTAIRAWTEYESTRDPIAEPDPLVSAALGVLYLFDDQPGRAYPRLRDAVRAFPNISFLTTYLADAALKNGDVDDAERLLALAATQPRRDPFGGPERVRAGLLAARGKPEEAERAYRAIGRSGPAMVDLARLLLKRGRTDEALALLADAARLGGSRPQTDYRTAMDDWWRTLPLRERRAEIRAALDENSFDPHSLVGLLTQYERGRVIRSDRAPVASPRLPGNPVTTLVFGSFAALYDAISSPSLQDLSLHQLAQRMEVSNMPLWQTVTSSPRVLKDLHASAWRWPVLRPVACCSTAAFRAAVVVTALITLPGNAAAQAIVRYDASLGTLPQAQCWTFGDGAPWSPLPTIQAGVLHQGPTDYSNGQSWFEDSVAIDFDQGFELEVRLQIVSSTFTDFGAYRRAGFGIHVNDYAQRSIYLWVGSASVNVAVQDVGGTLGPVIPFDTVSSVHTYRIVTAAGMVSFSIDSVPTLSVPLGVPDAGHATSRVSFGDLSSFGSGESYIHSIVYSGTGPLSAPLADCNANGIEDDCDIARGVVFSATASASDDQSIPELSIVTLDASASTASCGSPSYEWTQIAGTPVTLYLADPVRPTFVAPMVPAGGETLTFQLVVSDGTNTSEPDVVNVHVTNVNNPPVAQADELCGALAVAEAGIATLDGTHSYDVDGESLTYSWTQTGGVPVTLNNANEAVATFDTPLVGSAGETLFFELTVSDGLDSSKVPVKVCVVNVNHAPVADAGLAQTVAEGAAVALDATGSSDQDGDTLTFAWTQISGPAVTLTGDDTAAPSFTAPPVGPGGATLVFRVTVDDGYGGTDDDEVPITVQDTTAPPECDLARASVTELWPPNHKLVPVSITGVTHPANAAVTITILGVTQDEPILGLGDGDTGPDAVLQGGTVLLRAERAGGGNGRVYRITFQADDGVGGVCTGVVTVSVPHDKGKNKPPAVDDGQNYGSLGP